MASSPAALASNTPHAFNMGKGMASRRCTPMLLSMMMRFCATLHASFQALTTNSLALASMLLGVLRPWLSSDAMAFGMEKELSRRAARTSLDTPSLPDLVHALVGKAVVPVQITMALAFLKGSNSDAGQLFAVVDVDDDDISSSRLAWYNLILSFLPSKNELRDTSSASLTIPLTLYVSDRRSATSFPTLPEAPMTAMVSPGCSALLLPAFVVCPS
mmetsp:Transcript_34199/g.74032  ORF Transcript_34199/g.74032 Transcript_34199/m.74032 type:complete len:216 (-) Transcript_34199:176-823(-)